MVNYFKNKVLTIYKIKLVGDMEGLPSHRVGLRLYPGITISQQLLEVVVLVHQLGQEPVEW